jgi:DNA-directed RNA polymerase delta subunit
MDYQKICSNLISDLREKEREVILRRFGLEGLEKETLQSIGESFGICRERVRQIEEAGLAKIKLKLQKYEKVFQNFLKYFKKYGELRREDILLADLGGEKKNEVYFLLSLREPFRRINQNKEYYSFWTINENSVQLAKRVINSISDQLQKTGRPLKIEELKVSPRLKREALVSYLEISKIIQKNKKGLYGLKDWPEINPRGVKDKAYLVFKELQRPLHFREVAKMIKGSNLATVHNELIRDERFVLIGRGIYALREWGYEPGEVKDVILKILKEEKKPLTKEEILEKIKKQRIVKPNTVFLNLSNKDYFERDENGRYRIKTAQI